MHLRSSRSASRQLRRPISSGSLFQSTIFIVDDLGDPKMARTLKRKVPHFFRTVYLLHPYAPISFCRWLHGVEWGLSLYSLKPSHHVFWGPHWGTIKWTFHWPLALLRKCSDYHFVGDYCGHLESGNFSAVVLCWNV